MRHNFTLPVRIGRHNKGAILDHDGNLISQFEEGFEYLAPQVCQCLNNNTGELKKERVGEEKLTYYTALFDKAPVEEEVRLDVNSALLKVDEAINDLLMLHHSGGGKDLKILISPIVKRIIEAYLIKNNMEIRPSNNSSLIWRGIEITTDYPFSDHALVYHKELGAFDPSLVKRVSLL